MEIGIGLPTQVADVEGKTVIEWAKRAEAAGFVSLGTVGRLVYPNYDDLIALVCGGRCYRTDPPHDVRPAGPAPRQCGPAG